MNDIITAIDEAIAPRCGYCNEALGANSNSLDFCSESHQERYQADGPKKSLKAAAASTDPMASVIAAIDEILDRRLHLGQVDQPLYAVLPEADTRELMTLALQATGHQVVATDDEVPADSLYRVEVAHCTITGDGPPATCDCDRTSLFIDTGDYGFSVPMPGNGASPIRLARAIRAINLTPETAFDIFTDHDDLDA